MDKLTSYPPEHGLHTLILLGGFIITRGQIVLSAPLQFQQKCIVYTGTLRQGIGIRLFVNVLWGALKGPYPATIDESYTMPGEGFKAIAEVSASIGKPVIATITHYPQMSNGLFTAAIDQQYVYLVANPGVFIPGGSGGVTVTYFCI